MKNKRVVIAMSGGVDSSVAAYLLKKQGYDVIGIFMKLWSEKSDSLDLVRENSCCSLEAATQARLVAEHLGIPFYVVNFEKEFKDAVVDYYVSEYEKARTPNPCVICNRDIKGEVLFKKMNDLKGDYLATGHYVKLKSQNGRYHLFKSSDKNKDQTYFLWTLTQEKLAKLLFPVGGLTKPEVRKIALENKIPTAERRDSQGICFIPDRNVCRFLTKHAREGNKPGPIVDFDGKVLGTHNGLINYTIGQRERLGLGGPNAYYVIKLDSKTNTLVVGEPENLYAKKLLAKEINWINKPLLEKEVGGRIRYGHPIEECDVKETSGGLEVTFKKAQRAITPGQSIVFYSSRAPLGTESRDKDEMVGGGVIEQAL